ncbi:type I-E CRISPR-associated protein Cas7/Cse4/CasC, partial [Salmonella enterica subsp. enterica serovar Typhimurium]|nr:type I-E CRISPR-associated protein Cas7/Cse4/CasC [Salmonella enterica subsp. enterica serovar Typhimurium]
AFLQQVRETNQITAAITRLKQPRASFDSVYGNCADDYRELNVQEGTGSLAELLAFVSQ